MSSTDSYSMDPGVTTSDVKPLIGRVWHSRTRLEWGLTAAVVVLAILLCSFIVIYAHCVRTDKILKTADDTRGHVEPLLEGDHCSDLGGVWYNTLGSELRLNSTHGKRGFLFGEYRTAVERSKGAAGGSHSIVVGASPTNMPGAVFAFSVMWSNGSSMTTWTGQCLSCDGQEKLVTSWLLRSKQSSCTDKWKSTMVGQGVFSRTEQTPGPRSNASNYEPSAALLSAMAWTPSVDLDTKNLTKKGLCNLDGPWLSDTNNELDLSHEHDFIIEGRYRNHFEHTLGIDATINHSLIYGIGNNQDTNGTVALFVTYDGGKVVTGWTGQCHVCGEGAAQEEFLETVWMHRTQVATCADNWKATALGLTTYRRPPVAAK